MRKGVAGKGVGRKVAEGVENRDNGAGVGIDSVDDAERTEKEFAERMHSIYELLNQAWNGRKDKATVTRLPAIRRRKCFSPMFMPSSPAT